MRIVFRRTLPREIDQILHGRSMGRTDFIRILIAQLIEVERGCPLGDLNRAGDGLGMFSK